MRNPYEPSTPRLAFAVAALAMTAITIGLLVVLPSKMEPESQMFVMLAESRRRDRTPDVAGWETQPRFRWQHRRCFPAEAGRASFAL